MTDKIIKIVLGQTNPVVGDIAYNTKQIIRVIMNNIKEIFKYLIVSTTQPILV